MSVSGRAQAQPAEHRLRTVDASAGQAPGMPLVHQIFCEQVRCQPDAPAVVCSGGQLTYSQLDRRANQVAHAVISHGVKPDEIVALYCERSLGTLAALFGVLKAGAAYLPLDPHYPSERLAFMLEQSSPALILALDSLPQKGPLGVRPLVRVSETVSLPETDPHVAGLTASNLAYVIYTSGSTGTPKGVMVEHRSLCNLVVALGEGYQLRSTSRMLQFAPFTFDASVTEVFVTLCNGGTLVIADPESVLVGPQLHQVLVCDRITHVTLPPSILNSLPPAASLADLTTLAVAGESCPMALVQTWAPARRFLNAYGPTETTVCATLNACLPTEGCSPPIGRAIANTRVHILDAARRPVAVGEVGEIYIGGLGVSRGYLQQPALTAERFVPDPFDHAGGGRLYRSGDLGRWCADGTVEYIGRTDLQVKVRGFRVEPGDVEAALLRHPEVREAVVIAREDSPRVKRLVGYVVLRGPTTADEPDQGRAEATSEPRLPRRDNVAAFLRAFLREKLPDFMVPEILVVLPALPLTPSGKIDRRALPSPGLGSLSTRDYERPQGQSEEVLAEIWQSLLSAAPIGRNDNFFELGGQSLVAVQLLNRLRRCGFEADVADVFRSPTLSALAAALRPTTANTPPENAAAAAGSDTSARQPPPLVHLDASQLAEIARAIPGGINNIQDIYPLTPLQEGILFHHLLDNQTVGTYVLVTLLSLPSGRDPTGLIEALQALIDRHDILRTAVAWEKLPSPVQIVCRRAVVPVEWLSLDPGDLIPQLHARMRPEHLRLDVRTAPLLRLQIAADAVTGSCYALLLLHHLIGDHLSLEILFEELSAHLDGTLNQLPPPVPYREHVAQVFAQRWSAQAKEHFTRQLGDITESTVPFGVAEVHGDGRDVQEVFQTIAPEWTHRVRAQARRLCVSVATLIHVAFGLVVARASARTDIVYGSVLLGRLVGSAGARRILGLFINTLPLRLRLQGTSTEDLVRQTHRELAELLRYEQASLSEAQRCSGLASSAPLFTAVLNYIHPPSKPPAVEADRAQPLRVHLTREQTNYPLMLSVEDRNDVFVLYAQTDRRIEPSRLTGYMSEAVRGLVTALEAEPTRAATSIDILSAPERHRLLVEWNDTACPLCPETLVTQLERSAEQAPDALALVFDHTSMTYSELHARANQLARHLVARGVGPEDTVGLAIPRSPDLLVGLLAILKCGAAYLPLELEQPMQRRASIIQEARLSRIVTVRDARALLPQDVELEILDTPEWRSRVLAYSSAHLASHERSTPLNPACPTYVIYTSGTTGAPKGVVVTDAAIVNRLRWMQSTYPLTPADRVLQKTPLGFDVSVWELLWPLLQGACVVLARPQGHQDAEYLGQLLRTSEVTVAHFVPSMLEVFLTECDVPYLPALRRVFCSGEALSGTLRRTFQSRFRHVALHNLYGPTEAAIDVTSWACELTEDRFESTPIGRPIANTCLYVLDSALRPTPVGVAGELHIAGTGLARGYLNRPNLTAERFVANPFELNGQRMYRTGDVARWSCDGQLEYLGRTDSQVKLRGYRIELSEIELHLLRHPQVAQAAVVAREDSPGERRLIGYVVTTSAVASQELRQFLAKTLPDYMVPVAIVVLSAMPLTANGKLDRAALPAPDLMVSRLCAPRSAAERALCALFAEVMDVERVGIEDNFFDLGGDSIRSIRLASRAREQGFELTPRDIMQLQNVAALAAAPARAPTPKALMECAWGPLPLTPIMHWLLERPDFASSQQAILLQVPVAIGLQRLSAVLRHLAVQHPVLQARLLPREALLEIPPPDGPTPPIGLERVDISSVGDSDRASVYEQHRLMAQSRLRPQESRMLEAVWFDAGERRGRLLLMLHHLIVDAVSWTILLQDLELIARAVCHQQAPVLAPVDTPFRHWALQRAQTISQHLRELPYWLTQLQKPFCGVSESTLEEQYRAGSTRCLKVTVDGATTQELLRELHGLIRLHPQEALVGAFILVLLDWCARHELRCSDAVRLDLEAHGRDGYLDLSRTVGWFTTLYPVCVELAGIDVRDALHGGAHLPRALKQIKEQLRSIPHEGVGYGVLRYLNPDTAPTLAQCSNSPISFNYLGQIETRAAGAWSVAPEVDVIQVEDARAPRYALELTAWVEQAAGGPQLHSAWRWVAHRVDERRIRDLAESWRSMLCTLVQYAQASPSSLLTPSDLPLVALASEDIEHLEAMLSR